MAPYHHCNSEKRRHLSKEGLHNEVFMDLPVCEAVTTNNHYPRGLDCPPHTCILKARQQDLCAVRGGQDILAKDSTRAQSNICWPPGKD